MKLSRPKLFYLYRCLLAGWFTRPTVMTERKLSATEVQALLKKGFFKLEDGATRITEAGKAELAIAGINTTSARAAEVSWELLNTPEKRSR